MTTEPTATNPNEQITETPAVPPSAVPQETPTPTPTIVAPDESAPSWVLKVDCLILGLVLTLTFFLASFVASNSDLWMHLAIGQRISEGTLQFGVDPFSWASVTKDGAPVDWVHQSWLFSWLLFQLHQVIGGPGLVFGKALLVVAAIALLSRIGWHESSRWFTLIGLAMAVLAMSGRLALTPLVVSLLFTSITLYVLHRAGAFALREDDAHPADSRWLWVLPPLFAVWANLDHWFIVGPMIVGICWGATGLARWFRGAGLVSGTKLGLIFGLGLLACLLNPFHVRVFQLPPELAYLILPISDSLAIPLPDGLVAGGRTLREMQRIDSELSTWTISSLSPAYWRNPQMGLNVAGLALYPLLLLGLLGFTMVALIREQPGSPTLQLSRFLVWLVFGVMALALYRMIPFFVLVAAPFMALTLGEFLQWQQVSAAVAVAKRNRGLNLARFVTVPFLLLLLYLAWPGWLHGTTEFNSPRRVAWDIRPDPSVHLAALTLKDLKAKGECGHVFNTSYDLGNYLAWYAPEVKYGLDTRYSLFAASAPAYAKARQALRAPEGLPDDWEAYFDEHEIDQVTLTNYLQSGLVFKIWLSPDQWRPRYGDTRVMVASWSGKNKSWPANHILNDLNRQAFGDVPLERRPPKHGAAPSLALDVWTQYLDGTAAQPLGVSQVKLMQTQYMFQNNFFFQLVNSPNMMFFTGATTLTPLAGLANSSALPAAFVLLNDWSMPRARDFGPPGLPILMVRAARQAVAENPHDVQAQLALLEANEILRREQEDRWINYQPQRGAHPSKLRDRMRQFQTGASLYKAVQLTPDQYEANHRLAEYYEQQNLLDLALEHTLLAETSLQSLRSDPKINAKQLDEFMKNYRGKAKSMESAVKMRQSKWKEMKEKLPPLAYAAYAYRGTFQDLVNDQPVNLPLGLGKAALDTLGALDSSNLSRDEQVGRLMLQFELLLSVGRAEEVAELLRDEKIRQAVPASIVAEFQLFAGGAVGDYEMMDQGAKYMEASFAKAVAALAPSVLITPTMQSGNVLAFTYTWQNRLARDLLALQNNELCNLTTLRGIIALEAGDTRAARTLFQSALTQAGHEYTFNDRLIAQRYLLLLNEQKR
jgi:hypothetical protein